MYCKHCDMEVLVKTSDCPLCKKQLIDDNLGEINYPNIKSYSKKKHLLTKLFTFIFLLSSVICGLINYLTYKGSSWSLIVIASSFSALLFFKITFKPGFKIGNYLFYLSAVIPALLIVVNYLTNDYKLSWSINYTLPILLAAGLFLLDIISISNKKVLKNSVEKIFLLAIFNMALIFIKAKMWTNMVSFSIGIFSLLVFVIFYGDIVREELKKRFHSK